MRGTKKDNGYNLLLFFVETLTALVLIIATFNRFLKYREMSSQPNIEMLFMILITISLIICIVSIYRSYGSRRSSILLAIGAVLFFFIATVDWYFPNGITISGIYFAVEELVIARWFAVLAFGNIAMIIIDRVGEGKKRAFDAYFAIAIIVYGLVFLAALLLLGYPELNIPNVPIAL